MSLKEADAQFGVWQNVVDLREDIHFKRAFDLIIDHEGGYVNDPRDPGGETKFGISKRAYPDIDIVSLELDDALKIYWSDYWKIARCDELPSGLDYAVFDTAVNMGIRTSIKMLQEAVGAVPDGWFGPATKRRVELAWNDPTGVLSAYHTERALKYAEMGHFKYYGKGWLRRTFDVHATSVEFIEWKE